MNAERVRAPRTIAMAGGYATYGDQPASRGSKWGATGTDRRGGTAAGFARFFERCRFPRNSSAQSHRHARLLSREDATYSVIYLPTAEESEINLYEAGTGRSSSPVQTAHRREAAGPKLECRGRRKLGRRVSRNMVACYRVSTNPPGSP